MFSLQVVVTLQLHLEKSFVISFRYRWAFVPEVDTEDSNPQVDIVETFQAYKPYAVRILDILNQNFGVITIF